MLEPIRTPARSDLEFALGRAYAASGQNREGCRNSCESLLHHADQRGSRCGVRGNEKTSGLHPAPTVAQRKTRAEALVKRTALRRCRRRIPEPRAASRVQSPRPAMELDLADALHRSGRNQDAKQVLSASAVT